MKTYKKLLISLVTFSLFLLPCFNSNFSSLAFASHAKTIKTHQVEQVVYITRTGSKFHRAGCRYLRRSSIKIDRSDAEKYYTPCSICNP